MKRVAATYRNWFTPLTSFSLIDPSRLRALRVSTMVEKDWTDVLLTDGADGFLPGVPLGCLGMEDRIASRTPALRRSKSTGRAGAA